MEEKSSCSTVKRKRNDEADASPIEESDLEDSDFENSDLGDSDFEEPDIRSDVTLPSSNTENEEEWGDQGDIKEIQFTGTPGLSTLPSGIWPIDFFNLLVDESFYELIVDQTNINASSMLLNVKKEKSRLTDWKNIDIPELKKFIGLILHMGTIQMSRIQDYWKKHRLFDTTCFSRHMGRNRFLLILRCFNFGSQSEEQRSGFYKINPIVNYFNSKMSEVYYPEKELVLENFTLPLKEAVALLEEKKLRPGIKLHILSENTGISLKINVDSARGSANHNSIALDLLCENLNKGHSVFIDYYFSNVSLVRELLINNTFCTGMLTHVKNISANLKNGEIIRKYSNGVVLGKWKSGKEFNFISSQYLGELIISKDTSCEKPDAILLYNKFFLAIARRNDKLATYSADKLAIKWYIKLWKQILEMLLLNSFYLYNKCSGKKKMTFYEFRLDIIDNLLFENLQLNEPITKSAADHLPKKLDRAADGYVKRKRCRFCYKKGIRKNTPYFCPGCVDDPGLCIDPCFKLFHQNVNVYL